MPEDGITSLRPDVLGRGQQAFDGRLGAETHAPEQGGGARYVRRRHRGAAQVAVAVLLSPFVIRGVDVVGDRVGGAGPTGGGHPPLGLAHTAREVGLAVVAIGRRYDDHRDVGVTRLKESLRAERTTITPFVRTGSRGSGLSEGARRQVLSDGPLGCTPCLPSAPRMLRGLAQVGGD